MPLQSGIIVVEKPPTVISTAGTPVSTTVVSQQQQQKISAPKTNQIYEYYETTQGVASNSGSGTTTLNNIIRRQKKLSGSSSSIQHYDSNQHGPVQILTEEYLEQTTTTPSGTVINITPNDLMNQTRFIKFVNADNTTNVIIDSSNGPQNSNVSSNQSNGLPPNSSHVNTSGTTSKVLVSNLTVLKQHQQNVAAGQQQHIGLINSKDLSYVTTSGKNIQKIVNIPVKTTVGGVQKVTIPRNVQVVTRIPTNLDGSNQNSTSSGQQILVQPKYISHNVVAGNNNNLTLIKKQGGGALKIQTKLNTGIKNTYFQTSAQAQQQPQTLYVQQTTTTTSLTPPKVKSQKILKQFNNAINNNTSTVSVATLGGSKQLQHHQQHQGTGTTKKHPKYNLVQNQHYTTSNIVSTIPPGTKINTIMPSDHFNNAATATGTIKFVNAQGNVIQQQSLPIQRNSSHTSVPQQPQTQQVIKFTSPNKHLIENSSPSSEDGSSSIYKIGNFVQTSNASNVVATSTSKVSVPHRGEEVMIVNGTQMTDEYSARILQQMAQKSYQQQHHQQQQQQHVVKQKPVVSTSMPPPQPVHQQVHQQNSSASIFSSPPKTSPRYVNKVSLERKEVVKKVLDTDYFRINSNEVKPTYTTTTVPVPSTLKPTIETTFVDNIPLPLPTKTEIKQEPEEIIGEEVRPVPLDTIDVIQQRLYAIHQDHTYHSNSLTASELHKLQASSIKTEKSSNSFILYGQNHQDDDANSVISNGSRSGALENDLGEETETAPEAEAEDDSVTRCICDFTHDDGYMICCDKCSCWQHVDCMGIDRQNIPEEYLCEQCQPRSVDKLRARNLQTVKRKEQQQLLLNTQFNNSNVGGNGVLGPGVPTTIYQPQGDTKILLPSPHLGSANSTSSLNSLVSPPPIGKKSTKLTKKKEFIKKSKKDKIVGGKKRENTKKISKKKNRSGGSVGDTAAEKHAANLRQWIENYEVAVTNHYSPELRARLHAINKQTTLVNSSQNYNYLENAVSIIPHAGGKIVIANFEIQPNTPIIELMGKYMLSTQYKNQNPSKNMNSPWPPTNYLQSLKYMYKIPGPFIFFYQWTMDSLVSESNELTALNLNTVNGPEVCVDTRTYGNDARFVRRSCRPNACLKHTFVNGSIHLYIVALTKIMASTEITIRHEPHDLLAIENKQLMAANPAYQNFSVQPTSTSCACGLIKECVFGVQTKPIKEEKSNKVNKKKMLQANPNANNRNRSTSSSGESNSGVAVSPNNNILASTNNALTSLTTNVLHDSGVYTSSSSPSVSIPSPSQQLQANTNIQSQNQLPSAPVLTPTIVPVVESQISNEPLSVESSSLSNPQESQPQMQPHLLDQPIQQQQSQPQSQQPPTQKVARTPKKSISESNDVNPAADSKENSPNKAKTEEKRESRKLTRDERKLEAIVRAIEKMEKNQQKKQDSKYSKRATSGSPSPKRSKLNSSSESGGDCKIRKKKKTKNMQKGCGMPSKKSKSLKKNPLKKQFSGNDSDVFNTSEESLLSPIPPQHQTSHVDDDDNLNKAADLLLAFAKNDIKTEPSHEEQTRNASTPISSNCLLVEAAVGPIDQDNNFKLPISQAKTKKTMMNNWFNQNEYALHIPCMDSPKSPGYDSPLASPSMALKKVEEFITQADGIQNLQQPSLQQVVSPQTTNQHPSTLQIQGVSTCANNSSVKKRWLRQAISEESETVSDSMTTPTTPTVPTPTTPITPNGFMTPLKKRRLLIDTSPVEISHDIKEEIEDSQQPPLSPKIEVKHEETEEVDINRSPSPGSRKIVVEDNQVKIEPEDPGSEEMQVDVEKEEVDDVKEIKEEIVIKQEIKEENNLEDILHSFHKENLLNLEARNREKKSALGDEKKTIKKEKKEKKKIKKKKKSKFSDSEEKNDKRKLSCSSTSSTLSSISILSNEVPPPQFDVPPIVTTPLPLPPPPPLPASIARIETPPPMTTTTLPPPPQSEVRAISTLPYYNTIYSKFNSFMDHHPVVSSSPRPPSPIACSILTPDYLDAKLKSYNSLGGFVSQRTSSLLGGLSIEINGSQSPTTSSTSMAINNTPVATSKPFTKTASHDPRLNPQLTAPEPAPTPKRKLSINEYRKRKQLSSESNAVNSTETSKVTEDPKDLPVPEQIEANLATDEIQIVKGLLSPNEMSSDENFEQQEQFEPETNNFEPETSTTVNSNINNNNDSTTTNFCSPNKTTTTTTSSTNATSTTTTTSSPVSSP